MTATIDAVWKRILEHEGDLFRTKTDLPFRYSIDDDAIIPSRTKYRLGKGEVEKVLHMLPLSGPGDVNDLIRGPAYIWGILHDKRIRCSDW